MADGSLGRRYARALVELGVEAGAVDGFGADLDRFQAVLDIGGAELKSVVDNPGITVDEKRLVVDALLQRVPLQPMVQSFLRLLVDKNRFGLLGAVRREYRTLADELASRARATVTTATPASPELAAQIRDALARSTGRDVRVEYRVDPDLIGGMVAQVGDTVYDASVRTRLDNIHQALVRGVTPGDA